MVIYKLHFINRYLKIGRGMTYIGLIIGALFGTFLAYRRKGKIMDILHYAAACAIIGGLVALIANVIILRLG